MWTRADLTKLVKQRIKNHALAIVFQDEPYRHTRTGKGIVAQRSVGGVVAALEPVVEATQGLWIAWGRGDADRLAVDARDHLLLPFDDPRYTLRRLWLNKHDVDGWYYGFSNSALWPLSHIAYVRPEFEQNEWETYKKVNHTFARIAAEETNGKKSFVWVHDYQLALVPQYLRSKKSDAVIGFFWHIPWPVREIFRICPWKKEILEGLLGSDLIGFHTISYCRAFLSTVAQELEAKVNYDASTVEYKGHITNVRHYPISIDYERVEQGAIRGQDRGRMLIKNLVPVPHRILAFSADRLDYTKGIIERIRGIDRFLEKYPNYRGQFVYLNILSPSRTRVQAYQNLRRDVLDIAERINFKYATDTWSPIYLVERSLDPTDLFAIFRNADLTIVSSLHDGMNLVAKEYVAAAQPKNGRLILSKFTGAAHEFTDAISINPYDPEQFADAVKTAIEMPQREREARMVALKQQVKEHNVFEWAGKFVTDLTNIQSPNNVTGK